MVITSALHAEGLGFDSQWNPKVVYISIQAVTLGDTSSNRQKILTPLLDEISVVHSIFATTW